VLSAAGLALLIVGGLEFHRRGHSRRAHGQLRSHHIFDLEAARQSRRASTHKSRLALRSINELIDDK